MPRLAALALTTATVCACAGAEPSPKPAGVETAAAAYSAMANPTGVATPTGEAEAATGEAPPPSAEQVAWWCICNYPDKGEAATACFTSEAKCGELKAAGSSDFAESECVDVGMAVHPSGRLSGAGWISTVPGVVTNPQCALDEAPLDTPAQLKALGEERFGELGLGDDAASVVAKIGEPDTKGPIAEEAATGNVLQDWSYPKLGLELTFEVSGKSLAVHTMRLTQPGLRTRRGVQVGDDYAVALNKYGDVLTAPFHFEEDDRFIVGSLYYGFAVDAKGGKVSSIFLGSMAE